MTLFLAGLLLGGLTGLFVMALCVVAGERQFLAKHIQKARRKQRAARFDRHLSSVALRCMIREAARKIADAEVVELLTKGQV